MGTPVAYKGEHFSRSVSFDTQEMDASACTCLLRLQRHSRVPEKSEVLMSLALGNLFYCFGRSVAQRLGAQACFCPLQAQKWSVFHKSIDEAFFQEPGRAR